MAVSEAMLAAVKHRLSMTGSFEDTDSTLNGYIEDVMDFMRGAGVSDAVIESHPGTVARGVDDCYMNGSGEAKWSPMFVNMVAQLAFRG